MECTENTKILILKFDDFISILNLYKNDNEIYKNYIQ